MIKMNSVGLGNIEKQHPPFSLFEIYGPYF